MQQQICLHFSTCSENALAGQRLCAKHGGDISLSKRITSQLKNPTFTNDGMEYHFNCYHNKALRSIPNKKTAKYKMKALKKSLPKLNKELQNLINTI